MNAFSGIMPPLPVKTEKSPAENGILQGESGQAPTIYGVGNVLVSQIL
jgi:hypothetical protein